MTTYSNNLRLTLIGTGEQQGTWGITTNTNLGTLLEEAIGGYVSVTVADSNTATVLTTSNGSADEARNMVINLTGTLSADRTVECPAIEKVYIVKNATSGGHAVTFKVNGQTGVSIPNGATYVTYVNGVDVSKVGGEIADGGTGATTAPGAMANFTGFTSTATAAGTTTLSNTSSFLQVFTGSTTQTVKLPDTSTLQTGWGFRIINNSTGNLTLQTSTSTSLLTVLAGVTVTVYCVSTSGNTTAAWDAAVAGFSTFTGSGNVVMSASPLLSGNVEISGGGNSVTSLYVNQNITGATTSYSVAVEGTIQSDVTTLGVGYNTNISTAAASFTTVIRHFNAQQGTIGSGSTVSSQVGFNSNAGLNGATTNYAFLANDTSSTLTTGKTVYGFYSSIGTPGAGTAWNLYCAGAANNYMNGKLGIGTTSLTNANLNINKDITGSATSFGMIAQGKMDVSVASTAGVGIASSVGAYDPGTPGYTINIQHFRASQGTIDGSADIQTGFVAFSNMTGAAINYGFRAENTAATANTAYGFYSAVNVSTGGGTTWAFYGAGTAWSQFNGGVMLTEPLWLNTPAVTSKSTTATLTGAELKTQIITCSGTSYTLTLPTGTNLDAAFSGIPSTTGVGFDFSVVNNASGTITIAVNTGISSSGTLTVAAGSSGMFRLRRSAANTYIVIRIA